jgi:carotenoid cleavage dioxygenase
MNQAVLENRFLKGIFAPIDQEYTLEDLPVTGEIPADLNGSFYRNGPNPRFSPVSVPDYHLFGGDGMTHAFHISDGKVCYRNRWIETAKFRVEREQGRSVIDAMNPFNCEEGYAEFVLSDKEGLANTACLWHAGKFLVLEEAHLPFEVDPVTLESKSSYDFDGKLARLMTAHPLIDPLSGDLLFFGYMASGPCASDIALYRVNPKGELTHSLLIPTAYPAMVHDFVVTENYIMLPILPLAGSLERAMNGGPLLAWEPDKGASLAIVPRNADGGFGEVRWVECDTIFVFHFMNGFDRNGVITLDGCQFDHAPLFPTADGEMLPDSAPVLHRWTIDMNTDTPRVKIERIDAAESEFPIVDPRYKTQEYRVGFYTSPEGEGGDLYNCVARFDHANGSSERYCFGPRDRIFTSEAIFVPKSDGAAEGEGYLMSVVTDMNTETSALNILDSTNVSAGPVATAQLPHRIPVGFHGGWRPAD